MTTYFVKFLLVMGFLATWNYSNAQAKNSRPLRTLIFAGDYDYGNNIEKGPVGSMSIFPETDTTVLFFASLNRGAPGYNMGELYGRLTVANGAGTFTSNPEGQEKSCKWICEFKKDKLIIRTLNDQDACGFGFHVYMDGTFKRKSVSVPAYFIDLTGKKYYFSKTKPEGWMSQ